MIWMIKCSKRLINANEKKKKKMVIMNLTREQEGFKMPLLDVIAFDNEFFENKIEKFL